MSFVRPHILSAGISVELGNGLIYVKSYWTNLILVLIVPTPTLHEDRICLYPFPQEGLIIKENGT